MTFRWPAVLFALGLLPPVLVAVAAIRRRRRARYAVEFTNVDVLASVLPRRSRAPVLISAALLVMGVAAMLVALARPSARIPVQREDATVVLVLDGSGSMQAGDVAPTRLDAAKAAALRFVDTMPEGPRIAVVGFSSAADVLSAPTTDRARVRASIRSLQAKGGTAIGDGLMAALKLTPGFETGDTARSSAVLLLSDGRNTEGRREPLDVAEVADRVGVPVFTVALGTGGAPTGELVPAIPIDPPDVETLSAISSMTGGRTFTAPTQEQLLEVYSGLASRLGYERKLQEVTFAVAAVAALLVAGGTAVGLVSRPALP